MNWRRTRAVFRKEALHIRRDARSLIMALLMPLFLLLLFGYALSLDVDRIPTAIRDQDRTPESRDLAARFHGSRYFDVLPEAAGDDRAIDRGIDRDRILLAVVIPRNYARDLQTAHGASVQLLLDGSDSNTASIALGYAEGLIAGYALELVRKQGRAGPAVEPRVRVWYNAELKSRNYIVPGLIAVILMIIAALLTSLTVAREWEMGTMEQLLSTPLRPAEFLLGKLGAFFVLGLIDMIIAVAVGIFLFGVPLRGNGLLLFGTGCVFLFGALCWGLLLSAIARSQLLAYQMGMLSSFLPAFLLSGFVYSIENMPTVIQAITHIVPARYFITALRAIFLKGLGVEVLWGEIAFLAGYAALIFFIATRKLGQKVA
jgi:ABC-2 type transport system permease protein